MSELMKKFKNGNIRIRTWEDIKVGEITKYRNAYFYAVYCLVTKVVPSKSGSWICTARASNLPQYVMEAQFHEQSRVRIIKQMDAARAVAAAIKIKSAS